MPAIKLRTIIQLAYIYHINYILEADQNGKTLMHWDELNRLKMLGNRDRGVFQYNVYDDGGERRIKYTLEREADIYQNGVPLDVGGLSLVDYHIYTNPYVSVSSTRQYTKHYYAGSQRFASRVMDDAGRFEDPTPFDNFWKPAPRDTLPNKAAPATKEDALGTYLKKVGMQEEYQTELRESYWRPNLYFLHADHLGTATFVTNGRAEATQYFRNLPWGETDVEQDTGDYDNPYKFNGKELDQESGLYYYGARYYNPRLGIWYGVDPLAEEYPGWSPYAYVFNNPIGKTDSTGMCPDGDCPDEETLPDPAVMIAGGVNSVRASVSNLVVRGVNFFRAEDNQINNRYEVGGDGSLILVTGVPRETTQEKLVNTFFDVATIGLAVAGGPEGVLMAEGGKSPAIKAFNDMKAKFENILSSSRAARREVMRREGIPTSQQPISQSKNVSGREYLYKVPKTEGGTQIKSVQQQTKDRSHKGQPHWEAGSVKVDRSGNTRINEYGRPKLNNNKSKVNY